jgi:hypothetical protein
MKTLIAALMMLCSSVIFAQEQQIDAKYVALYEWAQELNNKARVWNAQCEKGDVEGCGAMHMVLNEQYTFFIITASRYTSEGDDCRAKMRQRVINNEIRLFAWNLKYAGVDGLSDEAIKQGQTEAAAIAADSKAILKEGEDCVPTTNKL